MPSLDRRLRILVMTHNYPRFVGDPAGAFVGRIAEGVAAQGHDVEVVAPHAPGTTADEWVEGVRLHRFRYAPDVLERVAYTGGLHQRTLRSPVAALGFPGFLLAFGNAVRKVVRRFQPHVLHAHWWFPAGWFASRGQVPFLITAHGSDVRLLERSGFVRKRAAGVFGRAASVTAVSRFLANDIQRLLPDLATDVAVTPMPVDVSRFLAGAATPKASPARILFAGNLIPSKGVDILLHAAAELSARGVEYQLKVLGEGPELGALQSLARRLAIHSRVIWAPFVSQAHMPAEYGTSTVTVLPTRGTAEGLGLTLVEALLAGSAVVGTPAGGIPEVVRHEETGLLARDGDAVDLANQIDRLLTDGSLRGRLIGAGKEYALRTYSPASTIGRFLEIYHALAHDQPHR
jgi:glycosyltransferase involved in cell wall biosynthesis